MIKKLLMKLIIFIYRKTNPSIFLTSHEEDNYIQKKSISSKKNKTMSKMKFESSTNKNK
jgi:hypothetical protein